MKKPIVISIVAILVVAVLAIGYFVPLGSYTSTNGCTVEPTPTKRLRLLLGESIEKVKDTDSKPASGAGCSINTAYTLYLF